MSPELCSTYSELLRISLHLLLEGLALFAAIDSRRYARVATAGSFALASL